MTAQHSGPVVLGVVFTGGFEPPGLMALSVFAVSCEISPVTARFSRHMWRHMRGGSTTRHAERSKAFRSPLRGLVGVCLAARALKRVPARARARHGARACGETGVELYERAEREPPKPRYYTERRPERTPMRGVFRCC